MGRTAILKVKPMAKAPTTVSTAADDRALLRAIAERRDRAAFAELFARHQQAAYNLARHLASSRDAAEDIVQEALLRIWSNADSFRGDGSVRSWLLRIVARESIRAYRKANAEGNRIVRKQRLSPAPETPAAPEDTEELVALRASVAQLPERQRTLLALYFGAEMSQEEIGQHLAMPQSSVSRSIQDLLDQLRGSLGRAGLAAAAPLLGAEQMQAAVLGGESAPAGLFERILSRLAYAGRSASVKAAAVSSSSAWIGWTAAAVLLAGAAAFWALLPSPEKPVPAETSAAAPAPETKSAAKRIPDTREEAKVVPTPAAPIDYHWTFDGKLPPEIKKIFGAHVVFAKNSETGRQGLMMPQQGFVSYLVNVPLGEKPVHVKATVEKFEQSNSNFGFLITDGWEAAATRGWFDPDKTWKMKPVDVYEYYIHGEWGFAWGGGKVRTVAKAERLPQDRFVAMGGQNMVLYDLEIREVEFEDLPKAVQNPEKLLKSLKMGPQIARSVIGEPDKKAPVKD